MTPNRFTDHSPPLSSHDSSVTFLMRYLLPILHHSLSLITLLDNMTPNRSSTIFRLWTLHAFPDDISTALTYYHFLLSFILFDEITPNRSNTIVRHWPRVIILPFDEMSTPILHLPMTLHHMIHLTLPTRWPRTDLLTSHDSSVTFPKRFLLPI